MNLSRLITLIRSQSLKIGGFTLASGKHSDYLIDLKTTSLHPQGAVMIADAILDQVHLYCDQIDAFGGMATGAIPIVSVLCSRSFTCQPIPGFFVRQTAKDHGSQLLIEGCLRPKARVVLIEDVITTGQSVLRAAEAVRAYGATVTEVIAVVDRLEGASVNLREHGLPLTALLTRDDILPH